MPYNGLRLLWTTPRTALSAAAVSTVNRSTPKRRVSSHRLDQDESENGASDFGFDRLSLTLSCPMNLKLFPLDKQTCSLSMVSCEYALSLVLELVRQDPGRALLADDIYRGTNKNRSRSLCRSTISKNVSSGTLAPPIDRLYLAAFIGLLIRTGLYIFFFARLLSLGRCCHCYGCDFRRLDHRRLGVLVARRRSRPSGQEPAAAAVFATKVQDRFVQQQNQHRSVIGRGPLKSVRLG